MARRAIPMIAFPRVRTIYIYIINFIYVTVDAKINLMVQKLKIVLLIYSCSLRNKLSFGTNSAVIEGCVTKLQMI